jgi:hypothetical protein
MDSFKIQIYIHQHNIEHIVNDKEFNENLTNVLNECAIIVSPQAGASDDYITTAHDDSIIHKIDIHKHIENWLREVVVDYCKEKKITLYNIDVIRSWANRIYRGVKGKPHRHNDGTEMDKVVILYYEAPKGSSDFVIIDSEEKLDSYEM